MEGSSQGEIGGGALQVEGTVANALRRVCSVWQKNKVLEEWPSEREVKPRSPGRPGGGGGDHVGP